MTHLPGPSEPVPLLRRAAPVLALAGLVLAGCGRDDPVGLDDCDLGDPLELAVGELGVRAPDAEGCLSFQLAGGGSAEYVVIAQETSRSPGFTPLQLAVEGGSGASAARRADVAADASAGLKLADARRRIESRELSSRIRQSAVRELTRRDVRPARRSSPGAAAGGVSRSSLLPTDSVPQPGDSLRVRLTVDDELNVFCEIDSARTVTSEVMATGEEVALLADTAISDAAADDMDWTGLADEYDRSVLGVPESYFGEATDIDGNERVLVLFTPEVNRLTDRGEDVRIGGFFIPLDLADSGDDSKDGSTTDGGVCPAGNEAEIVYLLAPDPEGTFSDEVSVEEARRSGIGASPGEFEHLINTGNRVIDQGGTFDQLESTWLDEGLSHLAEEVVGLERAGLPVRENLTLADAVPSGDDEALAAFNTFQLQNFLRLRHFLSNPDSTRALADEDPQDTESLEMRGFAHLFLRWLGDRYGPEGSGEVEGSAEQQLFRELARGSGQLATGTDNVEAAVGQVSGSGVAWNGLIRDFAAAVAADDTVPGAAPRHRILTWDLPAIFRGLHQNFEEQGVSDNPFPEPYPLELTDLGSPADARVSLEVQAAASRYFRVSAPGGSTLTLSLTGPGGSLLGSGASSRLLVLRAQ